MYKSISEIHKNYGYDEIKEETILGNILLKVFNKDNNLDFEDSNVLWLKGDFQKYLEFDEGTRIEYLIKAVSKGNTNAMHSLGLYYCYEQGNVPEGVYYIFQAAKLNHIESLLEACNWVKDFKISKNYLIQAINLGSSEAIIKLADLYKDNLDYINMKKYYLMAIDLGSGYSAYQLGKYYQKESLKSRSHNLDYIFLTDSFCQYYLEAVRLNYFRAAIDLGKFYEDSFYIKSEEYYLIGLINSYNYSYFLNINIHRNKLSIYKIVEKSSLPSKLYEELFKDIEVFRYLTSKIDFPKTNKIFKTLYYKYIINNIECKDNYITDFKILIDNSQYFIHSLILDSQYFENLIDGQFQCKKEVSMGYDKDTIDILLKYLYLGEFEYQKLSEANIENLLSLADEFMFDKLKENCEIILKLTLFAKR